MHISKLFNFLLIILFACCSPKIVYVPIETNTEVRDSLVISYRDCTLVHHKTVNKDYSNLLDTLHIKGEHSSMTAFADTTNFTIKGELNEDPYVQKIVYRDRWKFRDSLVYQEVPVEVPVETIVKVVPWWAKALSSIGILALIAGLIFTVVKLKI